ncbi:MAG: dephospho-CoA kinase [Candidatus Bacteroides intestinipullorum]|uniref:Dephospho-CoA kinase n=1 Tax=Candidatus Bacteroides intestinipullorum TaxID=2838471 RepID=A0A9E2KEU7_9BACE|nr:dephospho-CoA kinase [Candidatus Bacteroides intestinipullorum]
MSRTVFNQAQLEMLDLMSFVNSPEALSELKQVISDHFAHEMQAEIDRLWEEGKLTEEKVEGFRHLHERTPYK